MKQTFVVGGIFLFLAHGVYGQGDGQPQPVPSQGPQSVDGQLSAAITQNPGLEPAPAFLANNLMKWRYTCVREYLRYPSPISPIGDGVLGMMGDESAFHLYILMTTKGPWSVAQTLTALDIIHNSFKQPAAIQNAADRNPRKSLNLFKLIQASAAGTDQNVKERIAAETTFLATVPQTITPPTLVITGPVQQGVMPNPADFPKP